MTSIRCAVFLIAIVGLASLAHAQTSAVKKGTVEKVSVRGAALEGNLEGDNPARDVYIYLPPSRLKAGQDACGCALWPNACSLSTHGNSCVDRSAVHTAHHWRWLW